jgi:hypothetical protein
MADWKSYKNSGPWVFSPQTNKWGYLNNPRWTNPAEPFVAGGEHDYDGRAVEEPLIWSVDLDTVQSRGSESTHHQCGHWHLESAPRCLGVMAVSINEETMVITGLGLGSGAATWKIIRQSDSEVMASGTGNSVSFSFVGEFYTRYELIFE